MANAFVLKMLNQRFLAEDLSEPCSHGGILLAAGGTVILNEDDGEWVINEAALSLMRTVRYGFPSSEAPPPRYYPEGVQEEALIHCCGAYMMFCPAHVTWHVRHLADGQVLLSHFAKHDTLVQHGLEVRLPIREYAGMVFDFAKEAKAFFEGKDVDVTGWELFEGQYRLFWEEYDELMDYIRHILETFTRTGSRGHP